MTLALVIPSFAFQNMCYIFIIVSVIFSQNKNAMMLIKGIKENVCFGYIARAGCSSSLESNALFS